MSEKKTKFSDKRKVQFETHFRFALSTKNFENFSSFALAWISFHRISSKIQDALTCLLLLSLCALVMIETKQRWRLCTHTLKRTNGVYAKCHAYSCLNSIQYRKSSLSIYLSIFTVACNSNNGCFMLYMPKVRCMVVWVCMRRSPRFCSDSRRRKFYVLVHSMRYIQ